MSPARRCFSSFRKFFPALKILLMTIPLNLFDLGTDILWTYRYLNSSISIANSLGIFLVVVLLTHNCVSSFYGLSIIVRQPEAYPRLWKTRFRRCCTCLLHLLGLGSLALHWDYFVDSLPGNGMGKMWCLKWKKKEGAEDQSMTSKTLNWKERHLESMQIIQAFVEALPQFLLQVAAVFISWTNGTEAQCFPSKIHPHIIVVLCCSYASIHQFHLTN